MNIKCPIQILQKLQIQTSIYILRIQASVKRAGFSEFAMNENDNMDFQTTLIITFADTKSSIPVKLHALFSKLKNNCSFGVILGHWQ